MAGPFPGMDPYIECQGGWPDFHNRLIAEACNALGSQLPDNYVPRVDERIELADFNGPEQIYKPDVLITRNDEPVAARKPSKSAVYTLEPLLVDISDHDYEEIRSTWLEVRNLPSMDLVTVVEVLSPTNKTGMGRADYLAKREELHARRINLVEIDLLLGGHRVPMKQPLRRGHYFAIVARGDKLPTAEVYSWTLRDPLPVIPIPLRSPDADVTLDLQAIVNRVYDVGRYRRTLRYDRPLHRALPLDPENRQWAEAICQAS